MSRWRTPVEHVSPDAVERRRIPGLDVVAARSFAITRHRRRVREVTTAGQRHAYRDRPHIVRRQVNLRVSVTDFDVENGPSTGQRGHTGHQLRRGHGLRDEDHRVGNVVGLRAHRKRADIGR